MPRTATSSTDTIEAALVQAALEGDPEAFRHLTEPCYRALHLHCYRMLGSFHDAEDLVQETFLRAWRSLNSFEGRARFSTWLYRIATNVCLKELERRPPKMLPREWGPPADPFQPPSPPAVEIIGVEPYPDALLGDLASSSGDPLALYTVRESVELAFLTAIQVLPPRQRAVLLLRDVLGWRAGEVAVLLESSVASVNSALQRARGALAERLPTREGAAQTTPDGAERSLLARYMRAWEERDMNALALVLKEDALLTMPPSTSWFEGRWAIASFFHSLCFAQEGKRFRLLPTAANGQRACGAYELEAPSDRYRFSGLMVLRFEDGLIAEITGFGDRQLFGPFCLPGALDSDVA